MRLCAMSAAVPMAPIRCVAGRARRWVAKPVLRARIAASAPAHWVLSKRAPAPGWIVDSAVGWAAAPSFWILLRVADADPARLAPVR